jgi:hypothetical protein
MDLTGMSTIDAVADAVSIPSVQPLLDPGIALAAADKAGEAGSAILSGSAAKVMGGVGKLAGKVGTALSVTKAGANMWSCMGW